MSDRKFKFNGDVYQVHPVIVKTMPFALGFIIGVVGSFGMIPFAIVLLAVLFVIAVVFRDGNIQ